MSTVSVEAAIDPHTITVPPDISVKEAIARMSPIRISCSRSSNGVFPQRDRAEETRASYVCVVEGERLLGLLTEREILRCFTQDTNLEKLSVSEVVDRHFVALDESTYRDLFCTINLLYHHRLRHLPIVTEGGKLRGVVTSDGICNVLKSLNPFEWRRVEEVMSSPVLGADGTASVWEVTQLVAQHRVSCVAIESSTNGNGRSHSLGVVTEANIVQFLNLGLDARAVPIQTISSALPNILRPGDRLQRAYEQMQQHQVRQSLVFDGQDELIGIVTERDLIRSLAPMELYNTVDFLHRQVHSLQAEKAALLERHNQELEQEDDKFSLLNERLQHEIEERQLAQAAQRASEELAGATFDRAAVSMFHARLDGQIVRANGQCCNLLGYAPPQLQGRSLFELLHPDDPPLNPKWLDPLLEGKRAKAFKELRFLHSTGSELWIELNLSVVSRATGEPDYLIGAIEDISDRKYGEALLQDCEERFHAIFEQAAVGMEICTLEGRFFRLNQKFCDIVGYNRIELLEYITHPDDLQKSQESMRQLLDGEIPHYLMEKRYICKDGSSVWVSVMLSLMRESTTGEPKYFIGIVQDIDARKRAEVALKESERRFRSMFESHKSIMLLIEPDYGAIIDANQAAESFYGQTQERLCRLTIFDLHHLSRQQVEQEMKQAKLELQNSFVVPHKTSRGEVRWVEGFSSPIEYHGKQLLFSILHDITDRKQAEEALRESQRFVQQIADSTPNILYIYDLLDCRHIYVNHEIITILGYTPEEFQNIDTQTLKEVIYPEDYPRFLSHIQKFDIAKIEDVFELEFRMKHANGQWRWLYRKDTLFNRNTDGKAQQILGTATDITERKQMEDRLQHANQELQGSVNQLQLWNYEMRLLGKMSDFLQACLTVEEAYSAISDLLQPLFPNCSGGVFVLEPSSNMVEIVSNWGEGLQSETLFTPNDCWALRRGLLHEAQQNSPNLFCRHTHNSLRPAESLCVPMMAQGEIMGLLYLCSQKEGELSEAKHQLARTVSEHLSLALANLKLRETLHNQSIRDPLTGLFNRRYMEESLQQALHRASRGEYTLGIVMVDVDHFKKYNDTWGHEAGDIVLRELAHFLQNSIRASDIACRYGGEELTLIFPGMNLEETRKRAEQICQDVRQLNLHYHNQPLGTITISLGIACFPEHGQIGETLIQRADAALYRAKSEGRDRVVG
ncbi:PAS domain S-box protein [Oscillatoriales cyanobacterium LEGE 11467]|uniref:PAS domain S-box protein n=1 Tax=Zarconia navalis LEGE 11467 TaxID=1828826 RepID=A0A928VWD4_9CYAN|nr:PAS domain S-box protein [Zarconia navalis]MBE9039466.1 PAS domain S-box protein [Zarconia navalis LEGE 11467]